MNKLEKMFYECLLEALDDESLELCKHHEVRPQVVVGGLYKVDFIIDEKYAVEIDGYEYHKTKEQRAADYLRERFLIKQGLVVIRFTGTEIFLSCEDCARNLIKMVDELDMKRDGECFNCWADMRVRIIDNYKKQISQQSSEEGASCG